ncbi:MAG: PAS domain S-box protein [Alphaproteobacteria bacterium]|nr:PAS domain S-box protein [Alphaproteobacteria bacterium]
MRRDGTIGGLFSLCRGVVTRKYRLRHFGDGVPMRNATPIASPALSAFESLLGIDQSVLDAIPSAVYVCARDGVLVRYNRWAAELWGRVPQPGDTDQKFCGAFRLFHLDGRPLPHASTPMEVALRTGEPQHNRDVIIERPDGSRIVVRVDIEPLRAADGRVEGAINCFQDMTDRMKAELSAYRLASIVDSSEDAVLSQDLDGIVTSWNRGAERLMGYSAEEAVGKPVTTFVPADRHCEEVRNVERILRGEHVGHYETLRRRKDGTLVDISLSVSPVMDGDGNVIGASKIARDITARKRNERSLTARMNEQAALYRFVYRLHRARSRAEIYETGLDAILGALLCSRAAILLFDEAGVMRFVDWRGLSDAYRKAVDGHSPWSAGETDPLPVFIDDIDAADRPDWIKATVKEEGIRALAFIPLVANRTVIGKFMVYYDTPHVFAGQEIDLAITLGRQLGFSLEKLRADDARSIAEKELRESEAWLRMATRTGKVGLWDWDLAASRVSWTDSLYSIYGVRKHDLDATVEGFVSLVHPDDRPRVSGALARAMEDGTPYEMEFRAVRPDGQTVWLFANATVLREGEKPVRLVGATVDITGRRQAEELLREKSAQLETVMETAPAAIWIAHDPEARHITGSRYAAEVLRMPSDINQSLSAPPDQRPANFRAVTDGQDVPPENLPVQRAASGQEVRDQELEVVFADGTSRWVIVNATPIRDDAGTPIGAVGVALDITERRAAEEHRKLLIDELNHRVKNTLAIVQGLAQQTFRGQDVPPEARMAFEGRLGALASAHNLLTQGNWEKAVLHEISDAATHACGPAKSRISFDGPLVFLQPKQAGTIAMALHELCTNAMKYGALSNETGGIALEWSVSGAPDLRLRLVWREYGSPAVSPPTRRGFGLRMIEQALAKDLRGDVHMDFRPEGLVCTVDAPLPEREKARHECLQEQADTPRGG